MSFFKGKTEKKEKRSFFNTTLQFKLSLMFFGAMGISACISLLILMLVFNPIMRENIEVQFESISKNISELESLGIFKTEQIIVLVNDSSYTIQQVDKDDYRVIKYQEELDSDGMYIEKTGIMPAATMIKKVGDDYITVSSFSSENITWVVTLLLIAAFLVSMVIGTMLTAIMSRTILQPIHDLNRMTSEVARGHFNVRVRIPGDREYGELARNFNKMAEELSSIETLRGDFVSNVSHEFKTPLASIQGFAKLLQDKNLSEADKDEYIQIIIDETTRLSKLSSNILMLTKLENQKTIGKKTRFSLDEQIRNIILVLEPEWSKKNIDLDIDLIEIWYVGNEELMAQIWQNIINNAIKFTPAGGEITIRLFRSETGIVVKISDNGPSIPQETIDKIFEKFYQADRSRATEGNGLGLALVKRVVDLCEGSVDVENLYEGGVCFTVELPYIAEALGK